MEQRLILINLLVKLGVAAAVSSSLVRSKEFKSSVVSRRTHVPAESLPGALVRPADHDWRLDPDFAEKFSGRRSEF